MAIWLKTAEKKVLGGKKGSVPRRKGAPPRIVLHTTETKGLPGYRKGKFAPHFTIGVGHRGSLPKEKKGVVRVWQHRSLDRTASALRHSPKNSVETNHMGSHCVQIEIITYIGDQPKHDVVGNKGELPKPLMVAVAGLVSEIVAVVPGINVGESPKPWWSSRAASPTAKQRMTATEWAKFNGICGHLHVPNNRHWDPGKLKINDLVDLVERSSGSGARSGSAVGVTTNWPMLLQLNDRHDRVAVVRGILQILGYGDFAPTDLFNHKVETAVRKLQKDEGITVDGLWGPETHSLAVHRAEAEVVREPS